ncbi:carbonic anhydrase [Hyalangium minutum]|uniref:carbonic anhydrase n=1 Tax=Hyalangium minutum TaxID=394096 RepID=A0A085WK74_9BACT|nr:carbonic anhydrase [Hyalangium minutum]KFE68087.1 Carbonic anhydrase [Hyalangium minutum]
MVDPQEALQRLKDGNRRFVNHLRSTEAMMSQLRRDELVQGQKPFAIVLGCSDSRVPAEIVFDQGLGDLFVIRVAGNIVAPSQVGSVEFAAEAFGTRLVVVMGHTFCGAIDTTLEVIEKPDVPRSPNLLSIVSRVRPAIEALVHTELAKDRPRLIHEAVRANVRASVSHLKHGSALLERLVLEQGLRVVGAEYSLESGEVDFFDV